MFDHDVRLSLLTDWLGTCLPMLFKHQDWGQVPEAELVPASGDASFRRYFRWQSAGRSLIVMDAPPPQEDCRPFVKVAQILADAGVHVPRILAQDLERGFLLLDDLGSQTWLEVLNEDNADEYFAAALQALVCFQRVQSEGLLPAYDEAVLRREVQLFPDWYVERHLGESFNEQQLQQWQRISQLLIDSALAQPRVFVHRDFMPRNLMLSSPNPGILDFQDALHGPISYDVTCLFKDAFISWPQARVDGWLERYWLLAKEALLPVPESFAEFLRASDLMGVQRHLKVIGIFARICHRDGKPKYLGDVPRFFTYLDEVIARRPELAELGQLLASLKQDVQA